MNIDYCACGHPDYEHVHSTGRCRAHDDDGPCPCREFEPDDAEDEQ